jgi:phosphoribosylglycinamide formyltransferase-1
MSSDSSKKQQKKRTFKQFMFGVKNPSKETKAEYRLAIFASGKGSTAETVLQRFTPDETKDVAVIITNNPQAGVLSIARNYNVPVEIICCDRWRDGDFINQILEEHDVNVIVELGYLKKIPIEVVEEYRGRSINLHPALLPKYGGKGMYGQSVHKAVSEAKERISGFSLHRVEEDFDTGEVVYQRQVELPNDASPDKISEMVRQAERDYVAEAISNLIDDGAFKGK